MTCATTYELALMLWSTGINYLSHPGIILVQLSQATLVYEWVPETALYCVGRGIMV
ncbi:hypothetical protein SAMN05216227_102065 [Pseudorhodobacter antarcticus]|uniref:Uncharacterized protein n=1 Tax=Pseudorhodobacter antarcticus TaxID=1077947 RepID=A0A1H8IIJ7_9RHOB|nr:hypothetical protein SAMN05216227_102065 [Pseudorhodobacter antarcticus]